MRLKFPITFMTMMTNNTANNMNTVNGAGGANLRAAANVIGGRIVSGNSAEDLMVNLQA